jgi:predicted nucleotidyltransferase
MAIQSNQKIALQYAQILKSEFDVSDVFLFGSTVYGNADSDSDIDIAVVSDEFTGDVIEDTFRLMKLRRNIDMRIEPHPFLQKDFTESNPFAREIINTGISLL